MITIDTDMAINTIVVTGSTKSRRDNTEVDSYKQGVAGYDMIVSRHTVVSKRYRKKGLDNRMLQKDK